MNIFLCSSKVFYSDLAPIITNLQSLGFSVTLPNSYENPGKEAEMRTRSDEEHGEWKASAFRDQIAKITNADAILVYNGEKESIAGYVGGSVLLEMYETWRQQKPIYLWNPIPDNMLRDEIKGLQPIVINGDLSKIAV